MVPPFTFGNPIKEPGYFIGRKAEIRQIVSRLLSSAHESTSVIGERRIGKTSLLYYLASPEVAAGLGLLPDKFSLVYIDFQGLTDITPTRFWQRVLKKMSRSVGDEDLILSIERLSKQGDFDLFDLEDLFQIIVDKGLTIVLLMDEFEYVTENPNFKNDFFGGLRALAIHYGLVLIPATRRELVDLVHSEEVKGSPFFNIFTNVVLRPFSRAEIDELLESYTRNSELTFAPKEKDFIWELGGGYPFFAQMAGYYYREGRLQGLAGETLTEFTVSNFEQQSESHYSYFWSHCSESEKISLIILRTLAIQKQLKKTIINAENLAQLRGRAPRDITMLVKRGLVGENNGSYFIFSPSFEKWIRKEILATPGEEESENNVENWLKGVGYQDVKNAKNVLHRFKRQYWPLVGSFINELSAEVIALIMTEF